MDYIPFYMKNTITVQFVHAVSSYTLYCILLYTVIHPLIHCTEYSYTLYPLIHVHFPFEGRIRKE